MTVADGRKSISTYSRVNQVVHSPSVLSENAFDWLLGTPTLETESLDRARRCVELVTLPATVADTVWPVARATSRTPSDVPSVVEIPGSVPSLSETVFQSDQPSLGLRKSALTTSVAMVFFGMGREVPKRTVFGPTSEPSASLLPPAS